MITVSALRDAVKTYKHALAMPRGTTSSGRAPPFTVRARSTGRRPATSPSRPPHPSPAPPPAPPGPASARSSPSSAPTADRICAAWPSSPTPSPSAPSSAAVAVALADHRRRPDRRRHLRPHRAPFGPDRERGGCRRGGCWTSRSMKTTGFAARGIATTAHGVTGASMGPPGAGK